MTAFNRLPNDLNSRAPCGTQYNQLHAVPSSRRASLSGLSAGGVSHIGYIVLYLLKDAIISTFGENKKASLQITGSSAPSGRHPAPHHRGRPGPFAERGVCGDDH